jgi:hypothetical protein
MSKILGAFGVVVRSDSDGADQDQATDQQDGQRDASKLAGGIGAGTNAITHANGGGSASSGGLAGNEQKANGNGGNGLTHDNPLSLRAASCYPRTNQELF